MVVWCVAGWLAYGVCAGQIICVEERSDTIKLALLTTSNNDDDVSLTLSLVARFSSSQFSRRRESQVQQQVFSIACRVVVDDLCKTRISSWSK